MIDEIVIYHRVLQPNEFWGLSLEPPHIDINIDIKPGDYPNSINPFSKGEPSNEVLHATPYIIYVFSLAERLLSPVNHQTVYRRQERQRA